MSVVYIATLGQRPEAITVAFDRLHEQYHYEALGILHTEPNISGVAQAFTDLRAVCKRNYPNIPVNFHEFVYENGTPLIDIENQQSAEAYYHGVLHVLYDYKR